MKKNIIYELSLRTLESQTGAVEFLSVILLQHGIRADQIIEYKHYPYIFLKIYFNSRTKPLKIIKSLRFKKIRVELKRLSPKSWKKKGEETFRPFRLTPTLQVIPEKDKAKFKDRLNSKIVLSTGLAFGTGLHETTRFMSGLIEKYYDPKMSFLDVGTGTGILTLVAFKNGAKDVMAVDLSKDCIKTAERNFKINGYRKYRRKAINLKKFAPTKPFNFVAANLITKELVYSKKKLLSLVAPKGFLAVSGISLENYSFFRDHFKHSRLRYLKVIKGKEWVAALLRKV